MAENAAATNADFLAAVRQGPNELRRERRIDSSATHAISHAMRVLDCLAAAFLIIGAIPHGVRRADWGDTEKIANKIKVSSTSQSLEPLGTEGRKIQDALFTPILSWDQYGPTDWLPWLRAKRNGRIHRASRIHWQLLHGHKKRPEGLLHPFPPNPELTDIELMVRASDADFANLRIIRRSSDVLDGAVESMTSYGAALGTALADCWDTRRKSPSVLCQRGAQWQDLERVTALDFTGYGSPPEQIGNQLHVGVALGKRLRAAHVMDDARHRWAD